MPKETRVTALTGSKDKHTKSVIAKTYIDRLESNGLAATFIGVPGKSHNSIVKSDKYETAVRQFLEERPRPIAETDR